MEISFKNDVPIERNNDKKEDLSNEIPNLFLQNYNRVYYYLNGKYNITYNKIHLFPRY